MYFSCSKCEVRLSQDLVVLKSAELISEEDGKDYIPAGYAYFEQRDFWSDHKELWCINANDKVNLEITEKERRVNGCCGLDGCDGPNMVCANCGIEVATAKLDCWMPHCIIFSESSIRVVT
jgi:hypothetical protein